MMNSNVVLVHCSREVLGAARAEIFMEGRFYLLHFLTRCFIIWLILGSYSRFIGAQVPWNWRGVLFVEKKMLLLNFTFGTIYLSITRFLLKKGQKGGIFRQFVVLSRFFLSSLLLNNNRMEKFEAPFGIFGYFFWAYSDECYLKDQLGESFQQKFFLGDGYSWTFFNDEVLNDLRILWKILEYLWPLSPHKF